jgi:chitinase
MKEMRAAFGTRYGLSVTLAPDYWYLRGFKPAAMQQYVDFMGFMSYDLHGPWDTDVETLGSYVLPILSTPGDFD